MKTKDLIESLKVFEKRFPDAEVVAVSYLSPALTVYYGRSGIIEDMKEEEADLLNRTKWELLDGEAVLW